MSTILHLSDLHLGKDDPWERATDDKEGFVPKDENSRLAVMRTSLGAVKRYLEAKDLKLDCVLISGDITTKHDPEGFTRFHELLEETQIAPPEQIVVVPGNHDVDWSKAPDDPEKYELFLENTRSRTMRTPLCDGVDSMIDESDAMPILDLDDALLVAVNSANWCGVPRPTTGEIFDLARVSEAQLGRLTDILRDYDVEGKVLIAALHHHLLPVTEDEEIKAFESFTNLARLRGWLRDHGFHTVLHGHKHASTLTWDHIYELGHQEQPPRRVLTVAAPSPRSWGQPVCRLIRIGEATGRAAVAGAPRLEIETIDAERAERRISPARVSVQLDPGAEADPGAIVIDADTADAAYERLLDSLSGEPARILNVTCVVRDASSARTIPSNFPQKDLSDSWLDDTVAWWQKATPALVAAGDAPFNHGERLYSSGSSTGALDIAADRLGSTKAMVLLIDRNELRRGGELPAFVALQLVVATDETGDRLDCVGYFRKQDLTFWWPVNVAELQAIQQRVLDLGAHERLRAGRLVTFSAEAIHDDVLPQLSGTLVDRAVDLHPKQLMEMAYGVAHPRSADQEELQELWTDMLHDIGDGKDFPSLGLVRLIEHLTVFRDMGDNKDLNPLIRQLGAVRDLAYRARRESRTRSDRDRFSKDLFELAGEALNEVAALTNLGETKSTSANSATL